jgi:hypothetical protein
MAATSLDGLPKELIRQICSCLPCESALRFTFVCRFIYQACDDWTVWRTVVTRNGRYIGALTTPASGDRDAWKQYVIAAAKAEGNSRNWRLQDLEEWFPQAAALCHPAILEGQTSSLMQLYGLALHDSTLGDGCESTPSRFNYDFKNLSTHTWQLVQAAAFSLSMHYLAIQVPSEECDELARAVPWLPTNPPEIEQTNTEETKKIAVIQHALANRIVGFLGARFSLTRATIPREPAIFDPPSATTIPFSRQMNLPLPFKPNSLESFCQCHLPAMADPRFMTDGPWTGTFGHLNSYPPGSVGFNSIGGPHWDGYIGYGGGDPMGWYPHGRSFEGVVRFELVHEDDTSYTLQSNNFHSQGDQHRIRLDVTRETGQLTMNHWHRMQGYGNVPAHFPPTDGVLTPFGIVSHIQRHIWLWLWKVDWSAGTPEEEV